MWRVIQRAGEGRAVEDKVRTELGPETNSNRDGAQNTGSRSKVPSNAGLMAVLNEPHEVAPIKISILMCAYNEEQRIRQAIHEVLGAHYPCEVELIVVDDGSTDATSLLVSQIRDPRLIMHRHTKNSGKGAALRTAVRLATGTHILPFDADLEYSAEDIPKLIDPIVKRRCHVVYGARLFGFNTVYQSYRYAAGNRFLTRMANVIYDASISDLHTCMKLMPLELFRSLNLHQPGFGLDTEVTAIMLRLGVRPFEVPISYYSRSHAEGKKINWRDAVVCMAILCGVRLRSKRNLASLESSDSSNSHAPGYLPRSYVRSALVTPAEAGLSQRGEHNVVATQLRTR